MSNFARVAGVLFLVSTGTYLIGNGLLGGVLQRPDFLANLYMDRTNVITGVLLELINAVAVVGIAMMLYPILKKHDEPFALGYFGSRIIESVLLIISAAAPVLLITLSKFISAGTATSPLYEALGDVVIEAYTLSFQLAMVVLSLGSILLCKVLYRSKLVPRWLSITGFIGYTALLVSSCLAVAGIGTLSVLYIPGAVFELVFPIWILIKGFKSTQ